MNDQDKPLKIREAADRLGVDYGTIRGAIERGLLPAVRQEDSFRILPADLAAYRDRVAAGPPRPVPRPKRARAARLPGADRARAFAEKATRWVRRPGGNPQLKGARRHRRRLTGPPYSAGRP